MHGGAAHIGGGMAPDHVAGERIPQQVALSFQQDNVHRAPLGLSTLPSSSSIALIPSALDPV